MTKGAGRRIGHLDMDAFFAAVEQHDNREYRRKPVIVGGLGRRGVVSTASYEAREYGVQSAMSMARARRLCPGGIYLEPRFSRYEEVAAEIRAVLLLYSAFIETISLDEAFLDLTDVCTKRDPSVVAAEIKERVSLATGLSSSIGVAPNRFLAKLASELDKPDGLMVIEPQDVANLLAPLSVDMICGVGRVTARRLRSLGFSKIESLREAPIELLVREFGSMGRTLYKLARGEDETPLRANRPVRSVSREETFGEDLQMITDMEKVIGRLAHGVAQQLKRDELQGRTMRLKVRFSDFHTVTKQVSLEAATDSEELIALLAVGLLRERTDIDGRSVRLLGVGVERLSDSRSKQIGLFEGLG